jgi:hypothetical protein
MWVALILFCNATPKPSHFSFVHFHPNFVVDKIGYNGDGETNFVPYPNRFIDLLNNIPRDCVK